MEKYYWNPTRTDRIGVCKGIFKEDNLTDREVEELVDTFPGQTIDFFGALRARIYDDLVRGFTTQVCRPARPDLTPPVLAPLLRFVVPAWCNPAGLGSCCTRVLYCRVLQYCIRSTWCWKTPDTLCFQRVP